VNQSIPILLSKDEYAEAGYCGIDMRQASIGRTPTYGCPNETMSYQAHIIGCLGEAAVAKWLNIPYDSKPGRFKNVPDVGDFEVRSSPRSDADLLLRKGDKFNDTIYILATTHNEPRIYLVGWAYGKDCQKASYLKRLDPARPECFVVPQRDLHPMQSLKRKEQTCQPSLPMFP
jgi:hypothetical protein